MNTHLIPKKTGSTNHFHFRSRIPKDLLGHFGGKREFQISLRSVSNRQTLLVSLTLKNRLQELFGEIRTGMKSLGLEEIKEILRVEVRKSILHAHHVHLGTNEFNPEKVEQSLESVSSREQEFKGDIFENLKGYEKELDKKLEGIIQSLEIELNTNSVNYKNLRRSFTKLYLLRYDWIKDLINQTGRSDDDFRRDVDEKLKMELFPELRGVTSSPQTHAISSPIVEDAVQLTSLQSTPISKGIELFLEDKPKDIRTKTFQEIETSLKILIEGLGDIELGKINQQMGTTLKSQLKKLPKNSKKLPMYRDKDFHELVEMDVDEKISDTTINKHLTHLSSFLDWSKRHGYANLNPFLGLKIKKSVSAREERDKFTEKELKQIFFRHTYLDQTNIGNKKHAYYWIPLISLFTGMRLNETCSLYIDNVREISGNHREKRWCFDILEEPERPQKKLKNLASRRIVPIHDSLLELGLIEFIELLKTKRFPNNTWKEKRLFEELPYSEGIFSRNVSRWWNSRFLPKLGLKTTKKTFHSLRHTVSDHLKQKGIEPHFINELLGHSSGNIDLDRYGQGYNPDILYNRCVKKIAYQTSHARGIDFLPLKVDWKDYV